MQSNNADNASTDNPENGSGIGNMYLALFTLILIFVIIGPYLLAVHTISNATQVFNDCASMDARGAHLLLMRTYTPTTLTTAPQAKLQEATTQAWSNTPCGNPNSRYLNTTFTPTVLADPVGTLTVKITTSYAHGLHVPGLGTTIPMDTTQFALAHQNDPS